MIKRCVSADILPVLRGGAIFRAMIGLVVQRIRLFHPKQGACIGHVPSSNVSPIPWLQSSRVLQKSNPSSQPRSFGVGSKHGKRCL